VGRCYVELISEFKVQGSGSATLNYACRRTGKMEHCQIVEREWKEDKCGT
jgi:hypothetical protein